MRFLNSRLFRNTLKYCEQPTQAFQKWQTVAALAPIPFYFWTLGSKTHVAEVLVLAAASQFNNYNEISSVSVEQCQKCWCAE
jgi:hypothetical protein